MKWIGLTGGIASGKSSVARILRDQGVPVIDADQVAHQVLQEQAKAVANVFGDQVLDDSGQVDRFQLGPVIFSDTKKREQLEALIHPEVQTKVKNKRHQLQGQGEALAIYDVPLLFEKKLQSQFDVVLLVYAPRPLMKMRLMERNQLSGEQAEERLNSQLDIEQKKQLADVVFVNDKSLKDLEAQVIGWLKTYRENK